MHGVALADAALLAVKMAPTDAEGEGIAEARAAATAIVAAAEDEAALLRADAQREVDNLARRRDAIADQLGSLREMLAPIARRAALGDATARNVRTS